MGGALGQDSGLANAHKIFLSWVCRSRQDPRLTVKPKKTMDDFFLADSYLSQRPPRGAAGCGNHPASINQLCRLPSKDTLYYKEKALNFSFHSWGELDSGK